MLVRSSAVAVLALVAVLVAPCPVRAIPVFAHRYGLSCQACHTVVPHLTAFGEAFFARGYRLPGSVPRHTFPLAVKTNLEYGSDPGPSRLPKTVVDEVEVLLGGAVGSRGSYFVEQYLVDGGLPGRSRDMWARVRLTPADARVGVAVRAGQFTLDLPLDPETMRETTDHYAIFDQTAGDNPFAFFAPKTGIAVSAGSTARGSSATVSVLQGHDVASGLPAHGVDRYLYAQHAAGPVVVSAYRYDGVRPLHASNDRFWREGYGVGASSGRVRVDAVYQRGFDSRATESGALRSSGGFVQLRYELSPRCFAIARYDATQDTAFARALIAGGGYRLTRNARLSLFETLHRNDAGRTATTLSAALLFAY